jgi:hypothetical protein
MILNYIYKFTSYRVVNATHFRYKNSQLWNYRETIIICCEIKKYQYTLLAECRHLLGLKLVVHIVTIGI